MTGHINYGGRVTDDNDRILLMSMLNKCYGKAIFGEQAVPQKRKSIVKKKINEDTKEFTFFNSNQYRIPKDLDQIENVLEYIESLPNVDDPMIFGMHSNANISYLQQEGNNMIRTILNV